MPRGKAAKDEHSGFRATNELAIMRLGLLAFCIVSSSWTMSIPLRLRRGNHDIAQANGRWHRRFSCHVGVMRSTLCNAAQRWLGAELWRESASRADRLRSVNRVNDPKRESSRGSRSCDGPLRRDCKTATFLLFLGGMRMLVMLGRFRGLKLVQSVRRAHGTLLRQLRSFPTMDGTSAGLCFQHRQARLTELSAGNPSVRFALWNKHPVRSSLYHS